MTRVDEIKAAFAERNARIIAMWDDDKSPHQIATAVGVSVRTVRGVLSRHSTRKEPDMNAARPFP